MEAKKIFVGNLPYSTDDKELRELAQKYGEFTECRVMRKPSGESRGFGFILFKEASVSEEFLKLDTNLKERRLQIQYADPIKKTNSDNKRIYVKNLPDNINNDKLLELFSQYAPIDNVTIVRDGEGKPRGYGFITFQTLDGAKSVIEKKLEFEGNKLITEFSMPRERKNDRRSKRRRSRSRSPMRMRRYSPVRFGYERRSRDRRISESVRKIYVGEIKDSISKYKYDQYFSKFGSIDDSVIMTDRNGNRRGFGFVTYRYHDSAERAVNTRLHTIEGRSVIVRYADNKKPPHRSSRDERMGREPQPYYSRNRDREYSDRYMRSYDRERDRDRDRDYYHDHYRQHSPIRMRKYGRHSNENKYRTFDRNYHEKYNPRDEYNSRNIKDIPIHNMKIPDDHANGKMTNMYPVESIPNTMAAGSEYVYPPVNNSVSSIPFHNTYDHGNYPTDPIHMTKKDTPYDSSFTGKTNAYSTSSYMPDHTLFKNNSAGLPPPPSVEPNSSIPVDNLKQFMYTSPSSTGNTMNIHER